MNTGSPPTAIATARRASSQRRIDLYLAMPKLAIGLLVVALIGLVVVLQKNEREEQRATLIADLLWLEQNLRFHLDGNAEFLAQLGRDLNDAGDPAAVFDVRVRHILKNNRELDRVVWLDARQETRRAWPSPEADRPPVDALVGSAADAAIERAGKLAKPVFTAPYRVARGGAAFAVFVPIYQGQTHAGTLVGHYSLSKLIDELVPWWFAQKYQLKVVDEAGATLVAKSSLSGDTDQSYQIPFDPPGYGLTLRALAYRSPAPTAKHLLLAAIVALSALVFWSLWAIRGHIRRRLLVEQQLREANAVRKAMEDSLLTGLRARDLEGRITYVNPAFSQMTGYSPEELVGKLPPMPYWAPEEMARTREMNAVVMAGQAPATGFEMRFRRKNGERFDALIYEAPLIDGDGRHIGWMGSVLDITERKQAEELARQQQDRLQHTSRLVTMGEMASSLAHELNQPLAAISSYTTGCLNRIASGQFENTELTEVLRKVSAQAQRAGRIIRQVHDFVRKREPRRESCAVAEIVDDSIALFEAEAKKRGILIERKIQGDLPEVLADPHMLGQVMFNLMRNAADAMSATPQAQRRLSVRVRRDADQIVVRVHDTGPGIAPEVATKLFTPFFTTKAEGMGMGLSICRSIIEFHTGRLWIENDAGTTFAFSLPIAPSPEAAAAS